MKWKLEGSSQLYEHFKRWHTSLQKLNPGLNGIRTHDPWCDCAALLYDHSSFSSPEAAIPSVSTKNNDLWLVLKYAQSLAVGIYYGNRWQLLIHYLHNPIIHLYYPPKRLHNHCLQFLLGHENVPKQVENNAYADFWGVKEVYNGICASSELFQISEIAQTSRKSVIRGLLGWKPARGHYSWCWQKETRPLGTRMIRGIKPVEN